MPKSISRDTDSQMLENFWREPVHRTVLSNGLTVILKPDSSAALSSVQVWVKTGSQHEGEHLGAGISHFLEHMLFKGTARRAGRDISATVQAHGGYINAYTTFDRTVYFIDLPSEHTGLAIDVLADAVFNSTLPEPEAVKEKEVILREIAMTRDDPDNRFWESLFATAFREHPYRHPIIGYRDVFSALTREKLAAYYRARYVPNNIVLVIAGDVEVADTLASIEKHFGSAPRASLAPVAIPEEPMQLARRESNAFEDVELTRGSLSWQIPGLAHPDAPALDLLAIVLGSGDSSILWQAIREKAGLVHTIDAQSWNPGSVGLFCVSFTCPAPGRAAALQAVERELARAATGGFTAAQLRKARRQLVVAEINTRKTMAGQASRLGAAEVVVGDLDYSRSYFERLAAVSTLELKHVLRQYVVPARTVSVSLNPRSAAPRELSRGNRGAVRPDFEETVLPGGARLLLQPDSRLPNLHLRLLWLGGPLHEDKGRRGASALLATMLTKDTRNRSAAEVARIIEESGGSFYPVSGNNSLGLAVEVLPAEAGRALDILSEAVLAPAFKEAAFATEREAQLADLKQDADDVVALGRKLVRLKFFGSHPLALDAHGDEDGVRALATADLAAMHRRLFVSSNVVLAVAGDFSPKGLVPRLKAFLARIPAGRAPAPGARSGRMGTAGDFTEKQQREQAVVFQAFPSPPLLAPDFYTGEVADELFSGMASNLFERVREEKGLAYFVRSARVTGLDAAMFYFLAGTAPERAEEVLGEIDAEIARVQGGGVSEAELLRCQVRLEAARRQSLQTNGARAMQAGLNALYGLPVNEWKDYGSRIRSVTRGDLALFAQRYLQRNVRTQLVVRP